MRADSSTKTTLQDLENAIKFLNKELTVKEIEDIYGDFNNPRFQAALQEAKGVIGQISNAINLRSNVLLRTALMHYQGYIKEVIQTTMEEITQNIADVQRLARNIKIAGRYHKAELKGVEMARDSLAKFLEKKLSLELDKLTADELKWLARDEQDLKNLLETYNKRALSAQKSAQKYRAKIQILADDVAKKEALQKDLEEKAKANNIALTRVDKAIYVNNLLTLSNVVSGTWEQIRNYIIY